MRNINIIVYSLFVMSALIVSVPAMAQFGTQDMFNAQAPGATFQSTSTIMSSGSEYSSNPSIGDDGTASTPNADEPQQANARRIGVRHNLIEVPDDNPIGDVVLPLLLLAAVYGVKCIVYRHKRRV